MIRKGYILLLITLILLTANLWCGKKKPTYGELFDVPFNTLTVTSTIPECKVLIDGKFVGNTPYVTKQFNPGTYYLEVIDAFEGVFGREIKIHKMMPTFVRADFTKKPHYHIYRDRRQFERERFLGAWIVAGAVEITHIALMPLVALAIGNELLNTHRFSAIEDNDWEYSRTYVEYIEEQAEKRRRSEKKVNPKKELSEDIKSYYSEDKNPSGLIVNENNEDLNCLFSDGKDQYLYFTLQAKSKKRVRLKSGYNFITIRSGNNIPITFKKFLKDYREYHIHFDLKEG